MKNKKELSKKELQSNLKFSQISLLIFSIVMILLMSWKFKSDKEFMNYLENERQFDQVRKIHDIFIEKTNDIFYKKSLMFNLTTNCFSAQENFERMAVMFLEDDMREKFSHIAIIGEKISRFKIDDFRLRDFEEKFKSNIANITRQLEIIEATTDCDKLNFLAGKTDRVFKFYKENQLLSFDPDTEEINKVFKQYEKYNKECKIEYTETKRKNLEKNKITYFCNIQNINKYKSILSGKKFVVSVLISKILK